MLGGGEISLKGDMKIGILDLIKKSGSVRKFKKENIKAKQLKLILEAGIWGPSLFGIQPWHFDVIRKKATIKNIASAVYSDSKKHQGGLAKLLQISARIITDSNVLIAVYIDNRIKNNAGKYGGDICRKKGWMAELLSTGAAIQNMFLVIFSIGLGGVWLDAPTIFPNKINKILNQKDELVAFLALGYPNQQIKRSPRDYKKVIRFI